MARRTNWRLWLGFLILVIGFFTAPLFLGPPFLRDLFPWPNLLVMVAGTAILGAGIVRAFAKREIYRGRIVGPFLGLLGCAAIGFFYFAGYYMARQIPPSTGAPRVGQRAPDFSLPDQDGRETALTDLLHDRRALCLIFYRGHW